MGLFSFGNYWGVHITPTLHMSPYIALASKDRDYVTATAARISKLVKKASEDAQKAGFQVEPLHISIKRTAGPSHPDDYPVVDDGIPMDLVPYFFVVSHGTYDDRLKTLHRRIVKTDVQVMNLTLARQEEAHQKFYANLLEDPDNAYTVLYQEASNLPDIIEHMVVLNPLAIPLEETNFQV